ncbi:dynamin-like GTPase mgm1 [Physocladia obscura]|uniref:dynamin GTPase n=1 Tax=Physocladia obscura TaxID=109957 RepID=A0AAD5T9A5_9FUNG|nr:dynamin-like GTPase mgm1 [Physocladia obscura]
MSSQRLFGPSVSSGQRILRLRTVSFKDGNGNGSNGHKYSHGFNYQQRRGFLFIPRAGFAIVRYGLGALGIGAGAAGYTAYKVDEATTVPDWVKESLGHAKEWMAGVKVPELPKLDAGTLPKLPTLDVASLPGWSDVQSAVAQAKDAAALTLASADLDRGLDTAKPLLAINNNANNASASASKGTQTPPMPPPEHDLMVLTKKLIEVRNLLKTVNNNTNLQLPSIVVIGSQSSGKSSVLEAIVGHEFLPKGSNMVTRRPIELTLIHSEDSPDEYGEFPQLGLGKINDFKKIQKTLTDLNLAVPDSECVSSKPIELRIYSPNVPDLTLVDLPGYIQIHSRNQPPTLKQKISDLCDVYIKEPNIILAVCAADVDLANSEALRASRKADPYGNRTIGVLTKMDLIDPNEAVLKLKNPDFPLQLGYVGVVCKPGASNSGPGQALIRAEDAFFKSHPEFKNANASVGTPILRNRLMKVLEEHMGRGLYRIVDAVEKELDDARYQFKVHYNDRKISPESYVAEAMDSLKTRFKAFTKEFGKPQVRDQVRTMLEERIHDICEEVYWNDPRVAMLPKICADPVWATRLDLTFASLTKSGVGRASVQLVIDTLLENMEQMLTSDQFAHHPEARAQIMQFSNDILRSKLHTTVDQVENTIKPYKFEVECTEQEWQEGVKRATSLLETTLTKSESDLKSIKTTFGRRRLRTAIKQIQKVEREAAAAAAFNDDSHGGVIGGSGSIATASAAELGIESERDAKLFASAREALKLQKYVSTLQGRLGALRSRQCGVSANKSCCPEALLEVLADKLTYTAVMFIYVELLNEFFFQLPREVDNKLYYGLSRAQILKFANENPTVRKHLEVQERKATLELVMEKLRSLNRKH